MPLTQSRGRNRKHFPLDIPKITQSIINIFLLYTNKHFFLVEFKKRLINAFCTYLFFNLYSDSLYEFIIRCHNLLYVRKI